jgi:hypothetical protein
MTLIHKIGLALFVGGIVGWALSLPQQHARFAAMVALEAAVIHSIALENRSHQAHMLGCLTALEASNHYPRIRDEVLAGRPGLLVAVSEDLTENLAVQYARFCSEQYAPPKADIPFI